MSVAQARDKQIVASVFRTWHNASQRRVNDLSLVESFKDIKEEGKLARLVFQNCF